MPEMHFQIRWPDGQVDTCYSPSLVVREHLAGRRQLPGDRSSCSVSAPR